MYTPITPRQLTLTADTEDPINFSGDVGAGATMVLLYAVSNTVNNQAFGACHPSMTMLTGNVKNNTSAIKIAALNGSNVANVYASANLNVFVIGWFDGDVTALTADIDAEVLTIGNGSWTSFDHSSLSPSGLMAIYDINYSGDTDIGTYASAIGAVDTPSVTPWAASLCGIDFVPMGALNVGRGCWLYKSGFYTIRIVGFIESGVEVVDPPVNKTVGTLGSWETVTPTSGNPQSVIYSYRGTHTADINTVNFARLAETSGGLNSIGKRPAGFNGAIVKADGSGNTYQRIDDAAYTFFVVGNVTNAGATSLAIDQASATFGDALTWTATGLGTLTTATMTDSQGNVIDLLSLSDTGGTIPALTDDGDRVLVESITVTVGDGTNTATDTFTLNPPSGYSKQDVLAGFSTTPPSTYQGFSGTVQEGEQSLYPTASFNSFDGLGGAEAVGAGTFKIYHISLDGRMESYNIIFGPAGNIVSVVREINGTIINAEQIDGVLKS